MVVKRRSNSRNSYFAVGNRTGFKRAKICAFDECSEQDIDYKNKDLLNKFTSDYGRILPRKLGGVCAKKQRKLRTAIIRARFLAILPYCSKKN